MIFPMLWEKISIALLGGIIGSLLTHWLATSRDRKKEFRDAGRRLREAFAPELAQFQPAIKNDHWNAAHWLKEALPRHQVAIIEFGFYLSGREKEGYERKWQEYLGEASPPFSEYQRTRTDTTNTPQAIDPYKLFQNRVYAFLEYTRR